MKPTGDPRETAISGGLTEHLTGGVRMDNATPTETWLPAAGYEGHYEVSNQGRVRSVTRRIANKRGYLQTRPGKLLQEYRSVRGPAVVHLYVGGKSVTRAVHRLVTTTFIGPLPDGLVTCHNNGNPMDNQLENLRYDSQGNNLRDAVRHGTHAQASKTHCPRGHEYTPENTRLYQGRRFCRQCRRDRAYRAKLARHAARRQGD